MKLLLDNAGWVMLITDVVFLYLRKMLPSGERLQKAMENHHAIHGKIHYFDWVIFNCFLLVHQRVTLTHLLDIMNKVAPCRNFDVGTARAWGTQQAATSACTSTHTSSDRQRSEQSWSSDIFLRIIQQQGQTTRNNNRYDRWSYIVVGCCASYPCGKNTI